MNDMSPSSSGLRNPVPEKPRILAVDDDRILLMMLEQKLQDQGHDVFTATNGREACEVLQRERDNVDVVLLDREMPEMNGLEVVAWMKQDRSLSRLPVIMQTGANSPEQVQEGIDAGVFYYLTKPLQDGLLNSVLSAAIRESGQQKVLRQEMSKHRNSFTLVDKCECRFRTLDEAENLSCFIANFFPDPDRVLAGLAELLINSVEHGNLGVTYEEKTELIAQGAWRDEIQKRQELAEFRDKRVEVLFAREEESLSILIQDQGKGFDWRSFMEIDPARATDNHGRGIAQANLLSFDSLEYNDVGNAVKASVTVEKELDW